MEQHFTHIEKNRARSVLIVDVGPPWPIGPFQQPMQGHWPACNSLCHRIKDSALHWRGKIQQRGWPGTIVHTHLNRTKYTLSLKQGKIFPHKVTSPAQAMRNLYHLIKKFQAQGPFLCVCVDYTHEIVFPNVVHVASSHSSHPLFLQIFVRMI